jgi:transposase
MIGMSNEKYEINLSPDQRQSLTVITRNGQSTAKKITHARILLMSDQHHPEGRWTDQQISQTLQVHVNTIARIRKRFLKEGLDPAISRKPRLNAPRANIFDGEKEAQLIAICCSPAPKGYAKWSLTLLVKELKQRGIVVQVCRETVRQALKKMNYNLGAKNATVSLKKMQPDSAPRWKTSSRFTPAKTKNSSH